MEFLSLYDPASDLKNNFSTIVSNTLHMQVACAAEICSPNSRTNSLNHPAS